MDNRSIPFAQAVITIRVDHIVERLSKRDQSVDQALNDLNVRIGFAGSRHNQQLALKTFSKMDRR